MNAKPRILGITLARGGSKSVPRKNIRPILGIPLIAYTIGEALKSKWISRYIVSTDDSEIAKISREYGAETPFSRPAEFATDSASSASALIHAIEWIEAEEKLKYDYLVYLMCTNPLKTVEDIDACIEKIIFTNAESVIAVNRLDDHHPIRIKKIVEDRIVDFCLPEIPETRRQDLKPDAYVRSGSIYVLDRNHFLKYQQMLGSVNSRPYILPPEKVVNVDTEIDFLVAEKMLQNNPRYYSVIKKSKNEI